MKKHLLFLGAISLMCSSCQFSINDFGRVQRANSASNPYTWTAASGDQNKFSSTSGTANLGDLSWTYTRSANNYTGWSSPCIQFGKKGGAEDVTLVSPAQSKVKSVSVATSSYNGAAKCSITIGSTTYVAATSTTSWETVGTIGGNTLSTPLDGAITIEFTNATRALYLKSISITYEEQDIPENTYTISYELDGGTNSNNNPSYVTQGSGITLENPTRNGYSFAGWYTDSSFNNQITEWPYIPTSNITFYAKWINLPISNISDIIEEGEYYRVTGEVIAQNGNRSIFVKDSTGGIRFFASAATEISSVKIGNTITFTAISSYDNNLLQLSGTPINLTILDENDTTINSTPLTSLNDITTSNVGKYVSIEGLTLTNNISTSTACPYVKNNETLFNLYGVQTYMKDSSAISSPAGTKVNLTGVITIYNSLPEIILTTIVECTKFTVTFHTDPLDANDPTTSSIVYTGDTVSKPSNPTKESDVYWVYTFDNWYDDSNCNEDNFTGDPFNFNTPITENTTLYARYTKEANTAAIDMISTFETKRSLTYKYDYTVIGTEDGSIDFDASKQGYEDAQNIENISFGSGVTATLSKGEGTNTPKYYNNGTNIRLYNKNSITFSSHTRITSITLTFTSGYSGSLQASNGTYQSGTWEGDADEITFTNTSSSQARITNISIEYEKEIKDFNFYNTAIRFGGLISKEYWNAINTQGLVTDYGIMLSSEQNLNSLSVNTIEEAFEADPSNVTIRSNGNANAPEALNEDYYLFNAKITFPNDSLFTKNFHAVAYMVVDGNYKFFAESNCSVKSLAQEYLDDNNLSYNEDSYEGSLTALAAYGE